VQLVIDTNILISALLTGSSLPAHLIALWREGRFDLLTSADQLEELMRVTRCPRLRERLAPQLAGRLTNELRDIAVVVKNLPVVTVSPDPHDNYLLATAAAGSADFLVTATSATCWPSRSTRAPRSSWYASFLPCTGGCHDGPASRHHPGRPRSRPRPTSALSLIG
jgi:uncharacterized protein